MINSNLQKLMIHVAGDMLLISLESALPDCYIILKSAMIISSNSFL